MKFNINRKGLSFALINILILISIIFFVSYFSLNNKFLIGFALIGLGILSFLPIFFFKIPFSILKGDVLFGVIDNGILAIFTLSGAEFLEF